MNPLVIFLLFIAVRIASVFIVQTFYVPDEYWQSLEVAHKLCFGYGHLTWEWVQGVRSYIYPLIIAGLYKILALLNLDTVNYLVILPRILQAVISSYADYRFYIWTGRKKWSIYLILVSFFWFYCASRTLANTFETALTTIALSYFPWEKKDNASYLWLVAICCFIRPTAAVIWLPLCVYHLHQTQSSVLQLILKRFLPIGVSVLACGIAIDSYIFGRLVVSPWEFIKYNFLHNIGSFYGTHPWYWYFLSGLPTVLGINFLPFIFGTIQTIRNRDVYPIRKCLLITILITLVAYSTVEHKEFRFVLILLPLCLHICVDTLVRWSYKASRIFIWITAIILLVGNLLPAYYLSQKHQRGTLEVMKPLAYISKNYLDEANNKASILFLMPCHSTPYYSHIHQNVTLRFLTCEPNLKNIENYVDEADEFYKAPDRWIRSHIPSYPKTAMPTHLVLYDSLVGKINEFLLNYNLVETIYHSDYSTERTGNNVLLYERYKPKTESHTFSQDADIAEGEYIHEV